VAACSAHQWPPAAQRGEDVQVDGCARTACALSKSIAQKGTSCTDSISIPSAGNFKTLEQAVAEYSADATRIALADAGDAMDDANFEHSTANNAILRITKEVGALPPAPVQAAVA
jgi:hypothetical protein